MDTIDPQAIELASVLIREAEGYRLLPYEDSTGHISIGIGRNLDAKGISPEEAEFLFDNDLKDCLMDLEGFWFFECLDPVRQSVVIDLRYNLGLRGLLSFVNMLEALEDGDYDKAALELMDSKYARQVGNRAIRNANILRHGRAE